MWLHMLTVSFVHQNMLDRQKNSWYFYITHEYITHMYGSHINHIIGKF
jgi:hypothetical protein